MTVAFDNDVPCTQYVLRIIMQNDTLVVKSVKTQYEIKSLQGRSVRLDVRSEDSSDKIFNIEIQNADSGAGARRARYNSALMDTASLPETYVILRRMMFWETLFRCITSNERFWKAKDFSTTARTSSM